ncbi:MAG: PEP-CTERM sorting domain-containing protein [Candidatus Omnitrophica bacterium]|nr:PEP-CTERM sorting domain-containing protein [Candidatus Omnitrophota bacterium]
MRRFTPLMILTLFIGLVGVSPAAAFSLAGGYFGPVEFKLTGFTKSLDNDPDSSFMNETWGIFQITSITTQGGSNLWTAGTDGEYLYGMFYGLQDANVIVNGPGDVTIEQSGGSFDLYLATQSPADVGGTAFFLNTPNVRRTATDEYDSVTNLAGAQNFFSGNFAPGILPGDGVTTVVQNVDAATAPASGSGTGYGDITPGSGLYASLFDSNGYNPDGTPRDLLFDFFVTPTDPSGPAAAFDQRITDPVTGVAVVPEPATVLLLSGGLFGAAFRRKRNA